MGEFGKNKSQWTMDILDDQLLKNLIDQQLFNHNFVNTIVISSPNNKKYISKDVQLYVANLSKQKGINCFIDSNINIAANGFNSNKYKFSESDTLIGISIPRKQKTIKEFLISVSELISPSEILIYSNYINRLFLNRLSKELNIEITLKKSLKKDLELGIVIYLNDKLSINKDSCMA